MRLRQVVRPGIQQRMGGYGIAGLAGNVGRTKARRGRAHCNVRTRSRLHMLLQQRADMRRGVGVDDKQLAHGR